jgi:cyclopropane fatty-acyl-phospholipid synthase-like methyltransferase
MASSIEYQQKMTDSFRWRYESHQDSWSGDPGLIASAVKLNQYLSGENAQVLDIGIGTGKPAIEMLKQNHQVTGIDLFTNDDWPKLKQQWDSQIALEQTDFNQWDHRADHFDAVLDNGCMHHQHPTLYSAYLNKIHKLMKFDSYLALNVYAEMDQSKAQGQIKYTDNERICKYFTRSEISVLLRTKGFRILETELIYRHNVDEYYLLIIAQKINEISQLELKHYDQQEV